MTAAELAPRIVPADPRTLPTTPPRTSTAGLPLVERVRAERKKERRAYMRRAAYRRMVAAALASTEETPRRR